MFHHIHGAFKFREYSVYVSSHTWTFKFREFGAAASNQIILRKSCNSIMLLSGFSMSIVCTFFGWGLIPSLVSMYPRYLILCVQDTDLAALTLSSALCNLVSTNSIFERQSTNIPLVAIKKSSMYA